MNCVFREHINKIYLDYLNDTIILGTSLQEHCKNIRKNSHKTKTTQFENTDKQQRKGDPNSELGHQPERPIYSGIWCNGIERMRLCAIVLKIMINEGGSFLTHPEHLT